jgi:hypothetical protein
MVHQRTGAASNTTTATDTAGNTYTVQGSDVTAGANSRCVVLTCAVTSALSAGTITVNIGGTYAATVDVTRWTGVGSVDTAATAHSATATTTPAAVTVVTTAPGDVVVGGISYGSATAPTSVGGGFTALTGNSPNTVYYGANAYLITSTAGTYGPSWVIPSSPSASVTVALKPPVTTSATAAGTISVAGTDPTVNELTNPSFEVDSNSDGLTDSWLDEHSTPVAPTYTQVGATHGAGSFAQRMQYSGQPTDDGTKKFEIYQTTPFGSAAPGQTLTFSVWVSGSFTSAYGFIGIEAFNSAHTYLGEHDLTITPTGTPQQFTVAYQLPATSDYVAVYLQCPEMYPASVVDLTLDDASLTSAPGPSAQVTASGSIGLAGSATTSGAQAATAAGAVTFAGTASSAGGASAAGAATVAGTVTGTAATTSTGGIAVTGTATPAGTVAATAAGSFTFAGAVTGRGAAVTAGGITVTATASAASNATAAGTVTSSGAAVGVPAATTAGTITVAGAATATYTITASGGITITGQATVLYVNRDIRLTATLSAQPSTLAAALAAQSYPLAATLEAQ